ncbi:hypothetical protein [Pantoea stewartii]|uniref:hypothetical protein n=1 Tax=Pantoea stewartii TaxID=66269 RepID=UPI0013902091|nr:hypothetical protein [Pantoea stewartii]
MATPYKILEEYVFYVSGLSNVKGRIVEPLGTGSANVSWQSSHISGAHISNNGGSLDFVRDSLFQYMDTLNASSKPDPTY